MKVYVIKSKQTKEYQTVVMDFIPDIRQSDIFIDYEVALAYCPSDCEVVECELMEKTELADYTKQVRKEVCEKIKKQIFNHFNVKNMEEYENLSLLDSLFTAEAVTEILDTILKEYQKGESNE